MTARLGRELVLHGGPGLRIDQSGMLSGVELAFVGNPTSVNRVREQPVDVPARKRLAATLDAVCCHAALCAQSELIGRLLDPAHAAEFQIQRENTAHR